MQQVPHARLRTRFHISKLLHPSLGGFLVKKAFKWSWYHLIRNGKVFYTWRIFVEGKNTNNLCACAFLSASLCMILIATIFSPPSPLPPAAEKTTESRCGSKTPATAIWEWSDTPEKWFVQYGYKSRQVEAKITCSYENRWYHLI